MEVHVRELFAGRWMEGETLDVEDSIENGRSVGIVRVDLHSTLADLRREIKRQIEREDVPGGFAFVEKLGKQLVEIWVDEEQILRVKDLVGRDPEILIVEQEPTIDEVLVKNTSTKTGTRKGHQKRRRNRKRNLQQDGRDVYREQDRWSDGELEVEGHYSTDETRRPRQQGANQRDRGGATRQRGQSMRGPGNTERGRTNSRPRNGPMGRSRTESRSRREDQERATQTQSRYRRQSNAGNRTRGANGKPQSSDRTESDSETSPRQEVMKRDSKDNTENERPGTVRIRKEHRMTEEVKFDDERIPNLKNVVRRSLSIDDLRSVSSIPEGFLTADSITMDDYFLDRKPLSFSALNLRDLERASSAAYRRPRFEATKMERRIGGLLNRIRALEDKLNLLKTIGQEHWRGRFYQLRRNTAPLEERVKALESEEQDIQQSLMKLFELRKPLRYGVYGDFRKNNYILEAQKIQNEINQLTNQLENIDLDLLKYRKMRNMTEKQSQDVSRDVHREKFLRHLLLGRNLIR